jgi:hypothetical protein
MKLNLTLEELDPAELQGLRPPDRLTALSLIYLGFPLALFFVGWVKIFFALPLLLLLCYAWFASWRICHKDSPPFQITITHVLLVCVALLWACFGGAGHLSYANRFDWSMRDAVLRDLTLASWPVGYDIGGPDQWLLRCPMGYYLPAAAGGKILGLAAADPLLWLWTATGVWIFLSLLPLQSRRPGKMLIAVAVVVLFSGMDILGWLTLWGVTPPLFRHMEWWAQMFQYSSNTTLLFWSPNHAIPAWIVTALFWRHWKTDAFLKIAPFLLGLVALWSPFPMIGVLPFYGLILFRLIREKSIAGIHWPLMAISVLLTAVVGAYLSMDLGRIPASYQMDDRYFSFFVERYPLFVLVEFGVLMLLLWKSNRGPIFIMSAVVLLVLPFVRFGPGNDLPMRGSIPALAFLCIAAIDYLQRASKESLVKVLALYAVLLLGAVTPFHEFYRAMTFPRWKPSAIFSVMDFGPVPPPHYVGLYEQTWRHIIFRDPEGILKTTLPSHPVFYRPEEYP